MQLNLLLSRIQWNNLFNRTLLLIGLIVRDHDTHHPYQIASYYDSSGHPKIDIGWSQWRKIHFITRLLVQAISLRVLMIKRSKIEWIQWRKMHVIIRFQAITSIRVIQKSKLGWNRWRQIERLQALSLQAALLVLSFVSFVILNNADGKFNILWGWFQNKPFIQNDYILNLIRSG